MNLKKKKYSRLNNQGLQKERHLKENNETTISHGMGIIKIRPQREDRTFRVSKGEAVSHQTPRRRT